MTMRVDETSYVQHRQDANVQSNGKDNKNDTSKITIFAKDGVLDVKEQQELLQDSIKIDATIQNAIAKGFDIDSEIKKTSNFLSDFELIKDNNNSFNTAIAYAQKKIQNTINCIKQEVVNFLQANGTEEFSKNESGEITGTLYKDANGKIYKTLEYEYDKDGNIIKHITKDKDGNVTSILELGTNGLNTHLVKFKNDNSSTEYYYDENGNENQRILKDKDGNIEHIFNGNKSQNDYIEKMMSAKKLL